MKDLYFEYRMNLKFDSLVKKHSFTLKCTPSSDERQHIDELKVTVFPNEFVSRARDSFNNRTIYGYAEGEHDHFSFCVSGNARTGMAKAEPIPEDANLVLYKYQTPLTIPGPCIHSFASRFSFAPGTAPREKALAYMEELYATFQYVPHVTNVKTSAEEALELGKGVCQDYSHILLSLCRRERIPCRYVVGMLIGEGASHAWVEICDNNSWIAIDPTNHLVVDDLHIKISSGRDSTDCIVNQGVFTGFARQTQTISVHVEERYGYSMGMLPVAK